VEDEEWKAHSNLLSPRDGLAAATYDGKIFVAGGMYLYVLLERKIFEYWSSAKRLCFSIAIINLVIYRPQSSLYLLF